MHGDQCGSIDLRVVTRLREIDGKGKMTSKWLLAFATIVASATAEIPSYIHVCGIRNPRLNQCVNESVIALTPKLRNGIPELDVPPSEPFQVDKILLADMPNFRVVARNVNVSGLSYYKINSLNVDLDKLKFDLEVLFYENNVTADCDVDVKILVPISGSGSISLAGRNVLSKITIHAKKVQRGGKAYVYLRSLKLQLDVKDYDIKFKAENFDKTMRDAVVQAMNDSREELARATRPNLERAISEKVLELGNKIMGHFPYDELFPDRE